MRHFRRAIWLGMLLLPLWAAPGLVPAAELTHIATCQEIRGKTAILPKDPATGKNGETVATEWIDDSLAGTKWTIVWTAGAHKGKLISTGGINDLVEEPVIVEQDDDHAIMVMQYDFAYWTYSLFVKSQRILVTAHKSKWVAGKAIGHLFAGTCTFAIAK